MKSLGLIRYAALTVGAAGALLAGCRGSQPPIDTASAVTQSRTISARANRGNSWMLPEATTDDLMYVTNLQTVTVYSYPKGKHVGTLKGFYRTAGDCSDQSGNVFIANSDSLSEYPHGGKKPVQVLKMSGYVAVDCSFDPTTGDLAVTWNQSASSENYVAIYKNETGTPSLYTVRGAFLFYCGYDDKGNLLVDGQLGYGSQDTVFVQLPSGSGQLKSITMNQSFQHVGPVNWDGEYFAVGDDVANKIYRFAISGSNGTLKSTLGLNGLTISYQWWIHGQHLLVPNTYFASYQSRSEVLFYKYPAGGSFTKAVQEKNTYAPYGVTVSLARH